MIKTALVIPPEGDTSYVKLDTNDFAQIGKLVGEHGHVEPVSVLFMDKRYQAYVHDEGVARMWPFNPRATAIYHNATRQREAMRSMQHAQAYFHCYNDVTVDPRPYIRHRLPPICGTMVLHPVQGNELIQYLNEER